MKLKNQTHQSKPEQHSLGNAAEFETLLRSGMEHLLIKTTAHQDTWGLGREQQWYFDRGSGELIFTFPQAVVSTPAQVVGRLVRDKAVWTWAWADNSFPAHLSRDASKVRAYGRAHGFQHLVTGSWQAEESHCWYMTALACRLCEAQGAYRAVESDAYLFLTFGEVTTTTFPEAAHPVALQELLAAAIEEFKVCTTASEQRQVCCKYLRKGAEAGFDQAELIHHLGLATPSVLDLAGYSAESAQNVLDLLRTITDDEIESCPA